MIESGLPREAVQELLQGYHVICSKTGEEIPLPDVKYWHVGKQIAYIGPEHIELSEFYPDIVSDSLETTKEQI